MTQQILCIPKCRDEVRALFPTDDPYPGEHVKFLDGTALKNFICDSCNVRINLGDKCCAHSIWADHARVPYYPWEENFIQIKEEVKS